VASNIDFQQPLRHRRRIRKTDQKEIESVDLRSSGGPLHNSGNLSVRSSLSTNSVIYQKYQDATDKGDKHAPKIEAGYTMPAEDAKNDAANDAAYNAQNDIAKYPFAAFIYDAAGEIAANQPN
jgi:hypothetical protein